MKNVTKAKQKEFKTFNEQIDLLKSRNLTIRNKHKLLSYLKLYNYQIFINGYNDPFMKNYQRITNEFQENVSENSIIDLFNFDRIIRPILLSNIQNIERRFSTMLTYVIGEKLFAKGQKYGEILKFEYFDEIFICKDENDKECLKKSLCSGFEKTRSDLNYKYFDKLSDCWIRSVPI